MNKSDKVKKPTTMLSDLFLSVSPEDREAFVQQFNSLRFCREVIAEYLEAEIQKEVIRSEAGSNYDSPAWAESQADSNGYRRALRKMLKLVGGKELMEQIKAEKENGEEG